MEFFSRHRSKGESYRNREASDHSVGIDLDRSTPQAIKWIKLFCSWPAASRVLRLAENSVLADMSATISALRSTVSALAPPEESAPNEATRVAAFSSLTPARCRPPRATLEISISALSAQPFAHFSRAIPAYGWRIRIFAVRGRKQSQWTVD